MSTMSNTGLPRHMTHVISGGFMAADSMSAAVSLECAAELCLRLTLGIWEVDMVL